MYWLQELRTQDSFPILPIAFTPGNWRIQSLPCAVMATQGETLRVWLEKPFFSPAIEKHMESWQYVSKDWADFWLHEINFYWADCWDMNITPWRFISSLKAKKATESFARSFSVCLFDFVLPAIGIKSTWKYWLNYKFLISSWK